MMSDPCAHALQGVGLNPLRYLDRVFETRW